MSIKKICDICVAPMPLEEGDNLAIVCSQNEFWVASRRDLISEGHADRLHDIDSLACATDALTEWWKDRETGLAAVNKAHQEVFKSKE